jgi:hypothetical protein
MEYQLILILGNGNYLFSSVVYIIFGSREINRDIQIRVVTLMIDNWEMYKKFVIGDFSYRLPIYNYNYYEHLMITNGEYADHVELGCISLL